MKKILHKLFLSCFKATGLIEKKLHFNLSTQERIQLKIHKMMCDACTRYEKQSGFLEKGIASLQNHKHITFDLNQLPLRLSSDEVL